MAKVCALDLHPRKFPTDACAAGFAGMRTIIRREEMLGFELLVGRSYAPTFVGMADGSARRGSKRSAVRTDPPQQRKEGP